MPEPPFPGIPLEEPPDPSRPSIVAPYSLFPTIARKLGRHFSIVRETADENPANRAVRGFFPATARIY